MAPAGPPTPPKNPSLQPSQTGSQPDAGKPQIPSPLPRIPGKQQPNPQEEALIKLLARMAEDNPAAVAEILQAWLKQDKK